MDDSRDSSRAVRVDVGRSMRRAVHDAFISGLAVVVPILVTVLVLAIVVNAVYHYLALFTGYIPGTARIPLLVGVVRVRTEVLAELLMPVFLFLAVLWVGFVVNSSRYGQRAVDYFDDVMMRIPGVGAVYESFRQMSDVILDSDAHNFREVKLVEFPDRDAYTIGFVTTETPEALRLPTPHDEMVTLFLPLAPNPVMGGHLVHMPRDRVHDVDLTVEEGLQAIVTSGVALAGHDSGEGLSKNELRRLSAMGPVGRRYDRTDGDGDGNGGPSGDGVGGDGEGAGNRSFDESTDPSRGDREGTHRPPVRRSRRTAAHEEPTESPGDAGGRTDSSDADAKGDR